MTNLKTVELKVFIPAQNFERSKQFYAELGFTQASDDGEVAYFHYGNCSFLLQNFYDADLAKNLMMHLLVEDVSAWHQHVIKLCLADKYATSVSEIMQRPWGMSEFIISDPSGVMWRLAQNN